MSVIIYGRVGVINLNEIIRVSILATIILSVLTSCATAEITDFYHQDTNSLGGQIEEIHFLDPNLKNYQISGVLFYPFISHTSANSDFETYDIMLRTFKSKEVADSNVIINNVKVEGTKEINFTPISKDFNKKLKFINEDGSSRIQTSTIQLIEELNDYDLKLIENKSELKVVINVSVEDGNHVITKDLTYFFEADIRKYSTFLQ